MNGDSPVMTDSERRAYRYGQAAPRLQGLGLGGMVKSWSNDSLSSYAGAGRRAGAHSCVCAPTTHPGSFRCKHHRHVSNLGTAGSSSHAHAPSTADADAKHQEAQEISPTDQEKAS